MFHVSTKAYWLKLVFARGNGNYFLGFWNENDEFQIRFNSLDKYIFKVNKEVREQGTRMYGSFLTFDFYHGFTYWSILGIIA